MQKLREIGTIPVAISLLKRFFNNLYIFPFTTRKYGRFVFSRFRTNVNQQVNAITGHSRNVIDSLTSVYSLDRNTRVQGHGSECWRSSRAWRFAFIFHSENTIENYNVLRVTL